MGRGAALPLRQSGSLLDLGTSTVYLPYDVESCSGEKQELIFINSNEPGLDL